jgi:hypothetical protein
MFNFLKERLGDDNRNNEISSAPLFPGSSCTVNKKRLNDAIDCSSACAFVSRMLTALASVEMVYRVSPTGMNRSGSEIAKKRFNRNIREQLIQAAKFYNPNDKKTSKTHFTRAIGNKLSALQELFKLIKDNKDESFDIIKKVKNGDVKGVSSFDLVDFKNFEQYTKSPHLFDLLDKKFEEKSEERKTSDIDSD